MKLRHQAMVVTALWTIAFALLLVGTFLVQDTWPLAWDTAVAVTAGTATVHYELNKLRRRIDAQLGYLQEHDQADLRSVR